MTPKQQKILDFISEYKDINGQEPEKMEIHNLTGFSRVTIDEAFKVFKSKNLVKQRAKMATYEVVDN